MQDIVSRTIYSILILTNVLGNSLVILAILRSRSMKTPMNYLLLSLAVADLTAGVFYVPPSILEGTFTHPRDLSGAVVCRLFFSQYFMWISLYSSVFSLVFIAFDRYFAIMKPFSIRHRITIKKLKIFIPVCWIISAILGVPYLCFHEFDNKQRVCRSNWPTLVKKLYTLSWLFAVGILPTSIMLVLYSRVIHRLWFEKDTNSTTHQAMRLSRKRITKTMILISAIYVVCWFPDIVRHVLEDFLPSHFSFSPGSSNLFHSIALLNSAVNPVIYAFQFENFRRELRKIFCCGRRIRRIHVTQRAGGQNEADRQVNLEMRIKET